jgi:hypothetical protein
MGVQFYIFLFLGKLTHRLGKVKVVLAFVLTMSKPFSSPRNKEIRPISISLLSAKEKKKHISLHF